MRSLIKPTTLKSAGIAAILTALACWPRLALWTGHRDKVAWLLAFLAWAAFFLWSFVFAWHEQYSGRPLFGRAIPGRLWLLVTLCGGAGAVVHGFYLDPVIRPMAPRDFPHDLTTWVAMLLFTLAFDQLFLIFAPFAFFVRLFRSNKPAMIGTVMCELCVMLLRFKSLDAATQLPVVVALVLFRIAGGWLVLHCYLSGGVLLVWWWAVLIQSRHLLSILTISAGN